MNEKLSNFVRRRSLFINCVLLHRTKRSNLRGIAINRLMKKSSIKSEPTEEAVHKQEKENVLRMATVV